MINHQIHFIMITNSKLPSHNVIFSIASTKKIPSQNATRPFQSIKMTFCTLQLDALPCPLEPPNEMVRVKEGHALPDSLKIFCSVWKGMPFCIKLPFNIYLDALPCPSEPQYDMIENGRACPSRQY